ncbi:MAG TPA: prepilin-type N-terminal cleavage/methylation domain-containing protein [Candidatus Omnitrophota bacterium]|nr:prepilin-type N-terminal cleavage/methylation domain-containing protein [Candidatus Omnitrophota bacterium]HPT07603.1 prepilin-type N-terminal cleavage/methylation domain-containing protein [Candidatus Omnitrophota bacterium]
MKRGFTLVEVLIASAISIIVLASIYSSYRAGLDLWENAENTVDLESQARRAMTSMVSELRNATRTSTQNPSPNASITSGPNLKQMDFVLPEDKNGDGYITDASGAVEWATSNHIQYKFIPGQKYLRRQEQGDLQVLAYDVSNVQFFDITSDPTLSLNEIRIVLTLTKTTPRKRTMTFTLTSVVKLRN